MTHHVQSQGVYRSGQTGQTVNLMALPSQVRILSRPFACKSALFPVLSDVFRWLRFDGSTPCNSAGVLQTVPSWDKPGDKQFEVAITSLDAWPTLVFEDASVEFERFGIGISAAASSLR